jgi:hypothetical protein
MALFYFTSSYSSFIDQAVPALQMSPGIIAAANILSADSSSSLDLFIRELKAENELLPFKLYRNKPLYRNDPKLPPCATVKAAQHYREDLPEGGADPILVKILSTRI